MLLFSLLLIPETFSAQEKAVELKQQWEISELDNPESVLYDKAAKVLYVSNVNGSPTDKDGNGYISQVSPDGKLLNRKWIEGLNAPKGMGIYKGHLFVADIDEVVEIDIKEGKIVQRYKADGATFLNDIAIDKKGTIYISNTFGFSGIYRLVEGNLTLWLKYESLNMPNGLLLEGKQLLLACWGEEFDPNTYATKIPGKIIAVDCKTLQTEELTEAIGNLDGLEAYNKGYVVTDWSEGKLWYWNVKTKKAELLLDLPQGSANLEYDKSSGIFFIPLMNDSKLVAYGY